MNFTRNILVLLLLLPCIAYAQEIKVEQGYVLPGIIVDGDTLALVKLPKVYVFPTLKFASREDYLRYRRLVRDVKKVYPYAQIARKTFIEMQIGMQAYPEGAKRKKYIKQKEDELMKLYSAELKDLTIRQGRILIKLVDRELNKSSYEIIKELRGGFQATIWQGVARMFGESLKSEYDAKGEDALIERIIIMIEQGVL